MRHDPLYQKLVEKWEEVTIVSPQTVGPLTPLYKRAVPYFKVAPWKMLVPLAFVLTVFLALLLQVTAVEIASFLQRGI